MSNKEYEYTFVSYDKEYILQQIEKLGGCKQGTYLFRIMVFNHPNNKPNTYLRVRDEGFRITMTFKDNIDKKFCNEYEVNIDNFDSGVNILTGLGCKKKYYYEKIREIHYIGETMIAFDLNPGKPERMEIEAKNVKTLDKITKKLGLNIKDRYIYGVTPDIYSKLFGIIIIKGTDLTFSNMKKVLLPLVKKNKKEFGKLIELQKKYYKSVIKLSKKSSKSSKSNKSKK